MTAEIKKKSRTVFAPELPYMVAGVVAAHGQTNILDIFEFKMVEEKPTLTLAASATGSPSTAFNSICWGKAVDSEEFSTGIIAGSIRGRLKMWNAHSLIMGDAHTAELLNLPRIKLTGGLEFNDHLPNLLAFGVERGRIGLLDIARSCNDPYCLETAESDTQGEISFLSWNKSDHKILASTSDFGITVVWDSRSRKPVTSFSEYIPRRGSILQWNPYRDKELMVASDDDHSPSLKIWDVRKPGGPVKDFPGHKMGVIAMSWCPHDHSYAVTCSRDKSTLFWDTINGKILDQYSNDYVEVHFHPNVPKVISASSSTGFGVYKVQFDESGFVDSGDERIRQVGRDHMFHKCLIPFDTTAVHTLRLDTEVPSDFYEKKAEAMLKKYELAIGKVVGKNAAHPEAAASPINHAPYKADKVTDKACRIQDQSVVMPNTPYKQANASSNLNTWISPPYQETRESAGADSRKDAQVSEATISTSSAHMIENSNHVAKIEASLQKESQNTLSSALGSYPANRTMEDADSRTLFVSNVHFGATKDSLLRHFNKFGEVLKVIILTVAATGRTKGSAYVEFSMSESADNALSLDGTSFMSRVLKVVRRNTSHPEAGTSPIKARSLRLRWKRDGQPTNSYSGSGTDSQGDGQATPSTPPSPSSAPDPPDAT